MSITSEPRLIFKYFNWNSRFGPQILLHHHLFFAKPSSLNDPYDCALHICYEQMTDDELQEYLERLLDESPTRLSETQRRQQINEGMQRVRSSSFASEQNRIMRQMADERFGICSASLKWDSISMWAYYAASHTGFCVGLNLDVLEAHFRNQHISPLLASIEDVHYTETALIYPENLSRDELAMRLITTKSCAWSIEDEIRLVLMGTRNCKAIQDQQRTMSIPSSAIYEVIVGWRTTEEDRKDIQKLVKSFAPHAKCYAIEPRIGAFTLTKQRVSLS